MFVDAEDYNVDMRGKYIKSVEQIEKAKSNIAKVNNLPRDQKPWLDNVQGQPGERNGMWGKTHSVESRKLMSKKATGRTQSNATKDKRMNTMMTTYGRKGISHGTHEFGNMSLFDFLDNNSDYVISLIDKTHRHKYHMIHKYILENQTSDTIASQTYRSVAVCNWMKKDKIKVDK